MIYLYNISSKKHQLHLQDMIQQILPNVKLDIKILCTYCAILLNYTLQFSIYPLSLWHNQSCISRTLVYTLLQTGLCTFAKKIFHIEGTTHDTPLKPNYSHFSFCIPQKHGHIPCEIRGGFPPVKSQTIQQHFAPRFIIGQALDR